MMLEGLVSKRREPLPAWPIARLDPLPLCSARGTQIRPSTFQRMENIRRWLTELGVLASRPAAFAVFLLYAFAWVAFGNGLEWHSLATLATWGMTLVIQRAEHRDTQAIHAKLDELLKVHGGAEDELMSIDDKDAEEVEHDREKVKAS